MRLIIFLLLLIPVLSFGQTQFTRAQLRSGNDFNFLNADLRNNTYTITRINASLLKFHNQVDSMIASFALRSEVSGTTWGSITGTLSSQTDLQSALNEKQATLISGTNIKTVNGNSLLGSGNITINAGVWGNITGNITDQTDLLYSFIKRRDTTLLIGSSQSTEIVVGTPTDDPDQLSQFLISAKKLSGIGDSTIARFDASRVTTIALDQVSVSSKFITYEGGDRVVDGESGVSDTESGAFMSSGLYTLGVLSASGKFSVNATSGALYTAIGSPFNQGIKYQADYSANFTSRSLTDVAYVNTKIAQTITNGVTTSAPSQDAVFDVLAGKQPLSTTLTTLASFGTALQQPRVNSSGTGVEWFTPTFNPFTAIGQILASADGVGTPTKIDPVASGNVFLSQGTTSMPAWGKISLASHVGSLGTALQQVRVNAGATALEYFTSTALTNPMTTTGDLVQSSDNSGTPARLAAVATGNVIISGGVGTISSWGKVGMTTHVSGILAVTNGGLGTNSIASSSLTYYNGTIVGQTGSGITGQGLYWDNTNGLFDSRRSSTGTNAVVNPFRVVSISTGAMTDGFGSDIRFYARDTDNTDNLLGRIGAIRAGADNTGRVVIAVTTAGTSTDRLNVASTGATYFGDGTTTGTARIHVIAGTTAASSGPLKLTEGSNPTSPEDGLINYVSNNLTFTETATVHVIPKTLVGSATLNFDLTALNYQDLTITVTGAASGDVVSIGAPNGAVVADVTYFGWVSGTNTVTVRCSRVGGGGAADPASGTFSASVIKP